MSGSPRRIDGVGDRVRTPLDRSSSQPLWSQLEAELRLRMAAGDFDERFPTDLELTRHYEVSRHTVREAVSALGRDGLVSRVRGRGTVVERGRFEQRLGALYSLFAGIESIGIVQASNVLHIGMVAEADPARRLGLSEGAEAFRLDRLRLADGSPLAIDRAWLVPDLGRPLLGVDFSHTALYDELEKRSGCRPEHGWERITPVVPDEEVRLMLEMSEGDAAFRVERLGRCAERDIEWRVTVIRGDRYSFFADWSVGAVASGGLRLGPSD